MTITRTNIQPIIREIYNGNIAAGWYSDPKTGERIVRNKPEMLMLMVSEIAEAMEGLRKKLKDDKLPTRDMCVTEMGDTFIRMCDFLGYLEDEGFTDAGEFDDVVYEKRQYNANRADHKIEARIEPNGKSF
jgi:hypothetical protein